MKILCTGDLHLGRRSSRLPSHLDGRIHSCAGCWGRIVDLALSEGVDVVALSGDLVDRENRFYEAVGPLEAGLQRLAGEGIVTIAVAGNHDHDVLPRLADGLGGDAFRLLGRGGRWERTTVRRGDAVLHLDGWSFPSQYARESPLAVYSLPAPDDGPVLGLLHADLDQPRSPYAPVTLAELRSLPVAFWLLGHVHSPALHEIPGAAPVLYPGSPQAMDPGETGAHGVWIVELEAGQRFRARYVPLSSVRYDTVEIDLTGVADPAKLDTRVVDGLRARLAEVAGEAGPLRCLSVRLRLVGRTPLHRGVEARLAATTADLALEFAGITAVVEKVDVATRPAHDLAELARGNDPVGVVARLLVALDEGADRAAAAGPSGDVAVRFDDGLGTLVRDAERQVADVWRAKPYLGLDEAAADGPDTRSLAARALARQASLLLDELLAQKEGE